MRQEVSDTAGAMTLFRSRAIQSAGYRLFGSVTVIVPPSAFVALVISVLALTLLGFVAWYVEIPQRARAVGVLMPPDGLLDIVASAPGRIGKINVSEGQIIDPGDLLLNITTGQEQLANLQLQALHAEIALLGEAQARQVAIDRNRLLDLDERLYSLGKRLTLAETEYKLQRDQVALYEQRLTRRQGLASQGSLSVDALDQERGSLLQARARSAVMRHSILEYEQNVASVLRTRVATEAESGRQVILHKLQKQRLKRQVLEHEHLISREIRASEAGVVARVSVRSGTAVNAGDALLKVYRPHQQLEAWLYLSSANAGFLQTGQSVHLRLDAYPYQVFGTSSAVVTSVSSVAIVPRELRVPLALSGPVFEVRARLDETHIKAFSATWPLAPGTSFQADLVQRRYKLYEWFLRFIEGRSGDRRA